MKTLRLGTRKSALAQAQSNWVADQLRAAFPGLPIELVLITTTGDTLSSSLSAAHPSFPADLPLSSSPAGTGRGSMAPPLASGGVDSPPETAGNDGKGGLKALFTKEIEEALLDNKIDLAVHSMKDLAAELPLGLAIGAVPKREDPRDVWVSKSGVPFSHLANGSSVGTGAVRRRAQLKHLRPDLRILPLRGNVDTRLRKLAGGELDGIILAAAGLARLGRSSESTETLSPELLVPAVGQGFLAIEIRQSDAAVIEYVKALDHSVSRQTALAERAFLKRLGGSCQTPIAAFAESANFSLNMTGLVAALDGTRILRDKESGLLRDAIAIGERLAERLLASGAAKLLNL